MNRLQDMYGEDFHPILRMAENAHTLQSRVAAAGDDLTDEQLLAAIKAWDSVAQYTEPKLKAIEISGELGVDDRGLTDTERLAKTASLIAKAFERIGAEGAGPAAVDGQDLDSPGGAAE